jgi:hypothetical protein
MGYIDESLAANEKLVYRARFHWLLRTRAYLTLAVFLVIAAAAVSLAQGLPTLMAAAGVAALGIVLFVAMMMPLWTTEVGVTNHRFIFKRGWLRRSTDELQLSTIEEVNLEQSAFGRLLDYGSLVLHGTGVDDIILPSLADPIGLRRALQEAMGATKSAVVVATDANVVPPRNTAAV